MRTLMGVAMMLCTMSSFAQSTSGLSTTRPGQAVLPQNLTLAEALRIALSNNTILRGAQARLDQTSGKYDQSRSTLLPQLGLLAHQNYQTINLVGMGIDIPVPGLQGKIGPFASMDARVSLSQDVFNLSHIRDWQSYSSRLDASGFQVNDARELVSLSVVSTYLDALRAKATRDALAEQTKLADDLYKITRERADQGASSELDANRALQKVNTLEQQHQESEQNYVAAKLSLANILQAHITADFDVADDAAYGTGSPPDRNSSIQTALASRADYHSAEESVRSAEFQVRSVKARRLPTFRLFFDDGQSGSTPGENNVNTYTLAGWLAFPIFTGGRIRGEIAEAEGALREAHAALDQNRSQIETDVLTSISGVEWALKELATSAGNVSLARQEVELTRQRFTQGVADNTELVNAQDRLTQADDAHIRAQYMVGLARANLARATGAAEKTYSK